VAVYDPAWVEAANQVLRHHRTGAVPEFAVTLHLAFDDPAHPDVGLAALAGREQFLPSVGRRADVVARVPYDLAAQAFAHDDQTVFVNEVLSSGALWLEGDMAKARFFLRGLVRNASPATVRALREIG
jgi:hypothetical protein